MTILQPEGLPNEIVNAARLLAVYMENNGIREWQLMGCCSRSYANHLVNLCETMSALLNSISLNKQVRTRPNQVLGTAGGLQGIIPPPLGTVENPDWTNATHEMQWIEAQRPLHVDPAPATDRNIERVAAPEPRVVRFIERPMMVDPLIIGDPADTEEIADARIREITRVMLYTAQEELAPAPMQEGPATPPQTNTNDGAPF